MISGCQLVCSPSRSREYTSKTLKLTRVIQDNYSMFRTEIGACKANDLCAETLKKFRYITVYERNF